MSVSRKKEHASKSQKERSDWFGSNFLEPFKDDPFFQEPDPPEIFKNIVRDDSIFPNLDPLNPVSSAMEEFRSNLGHFQIAFPKLRFRPFDVPSPRFPTDATDCHTFTTSSVMTYQKKGNEEPETYQASVSNYEGSLGAGQSRKCVRDSRTGTEKMSVGYRLGEKARVLEKRKDRRTGKIEEDQQLINIDESEVEDFQAEWMNNVGSRNPFSISKFHTRAMLEDKKK
ncbi:myeloid leukemia factor 1-like [Centruroides sculpturatus]|uniref:myeloid leukemia factor 1-like n=1 Tax=Centruroides sculpturatus TaxID=218467 RepID=UPI000C6CE1C8|nr:myeloid leukemia factor 1-like [Centruroides sculpturatus]